MPPEMIRPLAETTLGNIVILAFRMGMQWRTLDPGNAKLQADGNGYTLDATDVKGLGIVLKFSVSGKHKPFLRLIPSKPVDQMICGVVPGCPVLLEGEEFHLIDRNRRCVDITRDGEILDNIGLPSDRRRLLGHRRWAEPHNELIILLLPFSPLEGSMITRYRFPGFAPKPVHRVFRFWESRISFLRILETRRHDLPQSLLPTIYDHLRNLAGNQRLEFFCRRPSAHAASASPEAKVHLLNRCAEVFHYTTPEFKRLPRLSERKLHERGHSGRIQYLDLVAAHVNWP